MRIKENQKGFGIAGIIVLIVILVGFGFGGWYIWQANNYPKQSQGSSSSDNNMGTTSTEQQPSNLFVMPDLGVEFEIKGDINPLYDVKDYAFAGVDHKLIPFTTQQMKAKGTNTPACQNFRLIQLAVFNSQSDTLKAMEGRGITASDIVPSKGFITIDGKVFYIPQGIESGQGICLGDDSNFEAQQRELLRESLMTLRAQQ